MVLKSQVRGWPGATQTEITDDSFVEDACLQYLHCTDDDQQFETVRLCTVDIALRHLIEHCCLGCLCRLHCA